VRVLGCGVETQVRQAVEHRQIYRSHGRRGDGVRPAAGWSM